MYLALRDAAETKAVETFMVQAKDEARFRETLLGKPHPTWPWLRAVRVTEATLLAMACGRMVRLTVEYE